MSRFMIWADTATPHEVNKSSNAALYCFIVGVVGLRVKYVRSFSESIELVDCVL